LDEDFTRRIIHKKICRCPFRWHCITPVQMYALVDDCWTLYEICKSNGDPDDGNIARGYFFERDTKKFLGVYIYSSIQNEYSIKFDGQVIFE